MIKITHDTLNNTTAAQAFQKLAHASGMKASVSYRIGRVHDQIQKEMRWGFQNALEIMKKYCVLNENGMPQGFPNKPVFKSSEDEQKHDEELKKTVLDKEIEFKVLKVHVKDIPSGILTGMDMNALDWFLEGLEDLAEGEEPKAEVTPQLWTPGLPTGLRKA